MNLMTKTAPWVVASLLAAASAFGQTKCPPKSQGEMMRGPMMAGYNAPARIDVRGSWDFYTTGSFTYWQPIQENMELGIVTNTNDNTFFANGNVVNMDFDYKPGFKVGIGMDFDHDNWDAYSEYTWFRGSHSTSTSLDINSAVERLIHFWGVTDGNTFTSGSEHWTLNMDFVDAVLARCYYVGNALSFRPFFGGRGAWIRQHVKVDYNQPSNALGASNATRLLVKEKSHSWAVGPKVGLNTNWMLGQGLRLYGNGAGDILYTRYTELSLHDIHTTATTADSQGSIEQHNLDYLRTHLELELGIGWGSYFDNNNWHVDLSAGYTFQVFFNQNMFRRLCDANANSTFVPDGNLYIQGLTANIRFDF